MFNLSTRNFSSSLFWVSSSLIFLYKFLVIFLAACNLYCRKGFTYRPKGIVKDGTKCRPDLSPSNRDICLGGKCMVGYYYNYHHLIIIIITIISLPVTVFKDVNFPWTTIYDLFSGPIPTASTLRTFLKTKVHTFAKLWQVEFFKVLIFFLFLSLIIKSIIIPYYYHYVSYGYYHYH